MIRSAKLVARYRELKAEAPGCVLLMQVGAFMQVMEFVGWTLAHHRPTTVHGRSPG